MARVLVTGGAGFIGSHIIDALVEQGHEVTAFDSLDPLAHPQAPRLPSYANPKCRYIIGDVRDKEAMRKALQNIEVVYHHAAAVGSGISMYRVCHYFDVNNVGTATLLELLIEPDSRVRKLIVASSMTAMGEGTYRCEKHGLVYPDLRPLSQLQKAEWEVKCPACGAELDPCPMAEDRPLLPTSIYGQTKMDQELACLMIGRVHRIPTVAFRYFCVYGPRQSLSNPYTGVIARFATRLAMNKPPLIYEDGLQRKDPIHVGDVVRANLLAMERYEADYQVLNIGSGCPLTILDMARLIACKLAKSIEPVIAGKFRGGDARHGWADISRAQALLGWKPSVTHEEGFAELCTWLASLPPSEVAAAADTFARLEEEAERKGLAV